MSLEQLSDKVRVLLRDHAIDNFANEARWLVAETLHISNSILLSEPSRVISAAQAREVLSAAQRRISGEPLSYILGCADFCGFEFDVDNRVLIPRPETEQIVDIVAQALEGTVSPRCLEVGVGSGCIAVSLLLKVPNLTMVATDISPDALELCRHNANKHGVLERLELVETSVFDTIKSDTFDWIVSNPPYIAEDDQRVADDVRRFEPAVALFAQSNGLAVIEEIAGGAKRLLGEHGRLIVEHGDRQSLAVQRIFTQHGFNTCAHQDLFDRMRFVEAWV